QAAAGQYSSGSSAVQITENGNVFLINNGSLVTPAEYIAAEQVANLGSQSLVLNCTTCTGLGTGYASGGSFAVAAINIPVGNFSNVVLRSGVTETSQVSNLVYTGTASVSGTLNTSSNPATVEFDGGLTVASGGSIAGAGALTVLTPSITNNGSVSAAAGDLTL